MATSITELKRLAMLLPKAELHLHIEGTLEPELMFELANKNGISIRYKTIDEVKKAYNFNGLQDFLNVYYYAMKTLISEDDFYRLTKSYLTKVKGEGVVHTEIFFDPQAHLSRGVNFPELVRGIHRALEEAKNRYGITSNLIMCFLRDLSADSAMEVLEEAKKYREWIKAVGLDSKEIGNPPSKFNAVFRRALEAGFLTVAHAGEEAPAEYIREALDLLKVSRIDHGYHIFDDQSLVRRIAKERVPVTACPISSVAVKYFRKMQEVPIKKMLDLGILVTINSDDPAYFRGYLLDNFYSIIDSLKLDKADIIKLARNSIEASFITPDLKSNYMARIDNILAGNGWP